MNVRGRPAMRNSSIRCKSRPEDFVWSADCPGELDGGEIIAAKIPTLARMQFAGHNVEACLVQKGLSFI